ncbi:MAG: hypothetical protein H6651_16745, partial [Ardenticatenales bacterium]|nr:hypothetical protein [Ardenticatenales bacterium]
MFVRVTLYDPAAQAHQVELPAAEPIGRILPVLIRRLRLPETDGGNPLQYDLYRAGAPEPLKPVATLHMAGITHGAALELRAAIDPYARVTEEELKARETHYRTARTPRRWRDYQAQIGLGLLALLALLLWGAYKNSQIVAVLPPPTARPLIVTRIVAPTVEPVVIQQPQPIAISGPAEGTAITAVAALPEGLCFVLADDRSQSQLYCHHRESSELEGLLSFSLEPQASELFAWAGELFLVQPRNAYYSEIWQSNGYAGGTDQLLSIPGLATTPPLRVGSNYLFGQADEATGWQALHLYAAGSRTAERFANLFVAHDWHEQALLHDGILYFAGRTADSGWELWRSDGTVGGTFMLGDMNTGPLSAAPADLVVYGDRILFVAENGAGRQIWQTDGTPAGTRLFWAQGDYDDPHALLVSGESLFFQASGPTEGQWLLHLQGGEMLRALGLSGRATELAAL